MKTTNLTLLIALSIFLLLPVGCGNNKQDNTKQKTDMHEHVYACPMHPDVKGKEGDKCSKCGMLLEHMDESPKTGTYRMELKSIPELPEKSQKVKLQFTPKNLDNKDEMVALDVEHDKKLHIIIVNDDLTFFDHIHPDFQSSGSYDIDYTFPDGGNYLIYADYKPTNGSHITDKISYKVNGAPPAPVTYSTARLEDRIGDYVIQLVITGGNVFSNETSKIQVVIRKNNKEISANTLDNYLGAKAHTVMIGLSQKDFLHVHPGVMDNRLDLQTVFEQPGIYRAWVQFQDHGVLMTADFVLDVMQGQKSKSENHHDHSGGHMH